jgi:hypothetical protein
VRPEGLGKFKNLLHRESNPRPSGLQHSALTTALPCTPLVDSILPIVSYCLRVRMLKCVSFVADMP